MLKTCHLTQRYPGVLAVDVCSIGPNGSGKRTTVKMIVGLIEPRDGQILFDGRVSMWTALVGLLAKMISAFALAGLMRSVVFGVSAVTRAAFVGIPLVLAVAAAIAILIPARRALRIE